jgi:glycosyltransferase involved in cell wall biosynthesis
MPEVSIIMPVRNRPNLTRQAIESLLETIDTHDYELIVVDDASDDRDTVAYLSTLTDPNIRVITMPSQTHHGACCNAGAAVARAHSYLYFSDNDVYFTPGWLQALIEHAQAFPEFGVLGADRHPYHNILGLHESGDLMVAESWTQVGYSMFMTVENFRRFGPFQHDDLSTYGKDDVALCNQFIAHGFKVGAIQPRRVFHCGITKTNGDPAAGAEEFQNQDAPEGVIYE